jgi:hypothetical protein
MRRLLLVAAVALSAACIPMPAQPAAPCTGDLPVDTFLFGDSLTAWASAGICQAYADAGLGLSLNALGGTRVDHHMPTFPNVPEGACALVFLGTNDLTNLEVVTAEWNALAALNALEAAGVRRVVWALLDENSAGRRSPAQLAETRAYNGWLVELAASGHYGSMLVAWDGWRVVSAGFDGGAYAPDQVHHTESGAAAYSAAQLAAHEACG